MCGFRVRDIHESFGGPFLAMKASAAPDGVVSNGYSSYQSKATTAALGRTLDAAFSARVASWQDRLRQLNDKEQRIVAWGAGAKATTFMNIVDPVGSVISHVIDINARKGRRFVPGSGQRQFTRLSIGGPCSLPGEGLASNPG